MPSNNIKEVLVELKQELTDYLTTKGELLQLKATEKGSPLVAKGIHTSLLLVLIIIAGSLALTTAVFALALLFVEAGTEAFTVLRAITFGALCLLGLFLLITLIVRLLKKKMVDKIEAQCLNKVLDQQEKKEEQELNALNEVVSRATHTTPQAQ